MNLRWLPERLAIVRFSKDAALPVLPAHGFVSVTRTEEELSLVIDATHIPKGAQRAEVGWRALVVEGPLDFSLVGVISGLSQPLAVAGISIFVISTYDTDILMVREADRARAQDVLTRAGHAITTTGEGRDGQRSA
ncbi:MAG: ACT domain-containing protein [Myxococcota bacterium]